ncbi:MAG: MerR family transcriptional regulator [Synechococcaceae cyanobacterium]|nr:MerR family transcriptional regulator [Synechococcaceae cyanobacterium]
MKAAPSAKPGLRIGDVARESGLPVKTIRFYSDSGLIQPIGRSSGGYRLFDASVQEDLRLIRTLRGLEIPLATMAKILEARRSGVCTCTSLQQLIQAKRESIRQRIESLVSLQQDLDAMLSRWQGCGKPDS